MAGEDTKDKKTEDKEKTVIRLSQIRKAHGINQTQLAKMLGVAQNTISQWETGAREIDFGNIRRICELFGVSANYLLGIPSKWTKEHYDMYEAADDEGRKDMLLKWGYPDEGAIEAPDVAVPREFAHDEELTAIINEISSNPELARVYKLIMLKSAQDLSEMLKNMSSHE